jgi:hypothetical protein
LSENVVFAQEAKRILFDVFVSITDKRLPKDQEVLELLRNDKVQELLQKLWRDYAINS